MNRVKRNHFAEDRSDMISTVEKYLSSTGKVLLKILSVALNIILTALLVFLLACIIAGSAFAIYLNRYVDASVDESMFINGGTSQTTKLYYYDYSDRANRVGEAVELEDQRLYGENNSLWASFSEIPQDLKDAFISIEDKRFRDHKGVDWIRSFKAVANFFLGFDDTTGGGSTITQQLIKNVTQYDDVTIQRKVQEMLMAYNLEKIKTKDEILELYLNIVPLSQRCIGVQAAANTYFSKDVSDLTLLECVCIASITNAPTRYDPVQHPENNAYRRNLILDYMLEYGCITIEEYENAYTDIVVTRDENSKITDIVINEEKLVLNFNSVTNDTISTNSWYTDTVISDVINDLVVKKGYSRQAASNLIYYGGLNIYTLMDPKIQGIMEKAYEDESNFPGITSGVAAESAMVVLDPRTGDLLGVVGARGEKTENRILNYATQTFRPPGSTIKPLAVYGPSIEEGVVTWSTVFDDVPLNFGVKDNDPWPDNLPYEYQGLCTVKDGLAQSKNTISLRTLTKLGLDTSFKYLKDKFQLPSLVEVGYYNDGSTYTDKGLAALGLGQLSIGASVRDMVTCYGALANNGLFNKSRSYLTVTDSDGNVILDNEYEARIIFSEETTFIVTKILEQVVEWGTSTKITLDEKIDCAGKTGTSNNDYDRWFMGYTPYYVGGAWYGYATPKSMTGEVFINPSNRIWDIVMTEIHKDIINDIESGNAVKETFIQPANVIKAAYCKDSGKLISDSCAYDPRGSRYDEGWFVAGTEPVDECDCHVLVEYDEVTHGIASVCCPKHNVIKVALLKLKTPRVFPMQITVTDAQYVYRDLPPVYRPGQYSHNPYFIALLDDDTYCGVSTYWGATQYNRFCSEHFDYDSFDKGKLKDYKGTYSVPVNSDKTVALLPDNSYHKRRKSECEQI